MCLLPDEQAGVRRDARVGPLERRGSPLRRGVHRDLRCRSCFKHLSREHVQVVEVSTPDRTVRRSRGKDDAAMARKAARSEVWCATLKARDGMAESLQVLTRAKVSALKARRAAIEQIRSLIVSAPQRCARPVVHDDNRPPRPQVTLHQDRARPASATLRSPVASPSSHSPVATRISTRWASSMQPSGPSSRRWHRSCSRRSVSARRALSS